MNLLKTKMIYSQQVNNSQRTIFAELGEVQKINYEARSQTSPIFSNAKELLFVQHDQDPVADYFKKSAKELKHIYTLLEHFILT